MRRTLLEGDLERRGHGEDSIRGRSREKRTWGRLIRGRSREKRTWERPRGSSLYQHPWEVKLKKCVHNSDWTVTSKSEYNYGYEKSIVLLLGH